jgi:hypothetical protein
MPRGARPRHAPGSLDQEDASEEDRHLQPNRFLAESYLEGHNTRYAVAARERADFHQAPAGLDLDQVSCLEEQRKVSNDWVVQVQPAVAANRGGGPTGAGGSRQPDVAARLRWHELAERPRAKQPVAKPRAVMHRKPAPEHPWRKTIPCGAGAVSAIGRGGSALPVTARWAGEGAATAGQFPCTPSPLRRPERLSIKGYFYRGKHGDISIEA